MTQFRVLPVRRGDAYLLRSRRGSYLMDGGEQGSLLPEMLIDRHAKKLRAAVCSSTCPERLGGIIEIMEAGLPVAEYWFPEKIEIVPEMARRFNGDWNGWLKRLGLPTHNNSNGLEGWQDNVKPAPPDNSLRRLEGAAILTGLAVTACLGRSPYNDLSRNAFLHGESNGTPSELGHFFERTLDLLSSQAETRKQDNRRSTNHILRRMGWRLFSGSSPEDLALLCGRLLNAEAKKLSKNMRTVVQGLTMATMTTAMLAKNESAFRFFRQTGKLEEHFIPRHPLMCLNGVEVSPLPGLPPVTTPSMMFKEARHMSIQSEGLAFQYGDANCGALFCGDTKMLFLDKGEVVTLDRPTVIAAPRQGNCSSYQAYARIASKNPKQDVWVRSHYSYARKVSDHFKDKPNKLCLNNCVHHTVQEVLLSHSEGKWNHLTGTPCICS